MAFIKQRFKTDCGVAALAMLCDVTWEQARDAIDWGEKGRRYSTVTKQIRKAAWLLKFGTTQSRLQTIRVPKRKGWEGKPVDHKIWYLIPNNSLVKIPKKYGWHWVIWRNGKVYDPARGVFKPEKIGRLPSSYMEFWGFGIKENRDG